MVQINQTLLQEYYRQNLNPDKSALVSNLTDISSGWESEVYSFVLNQDGKPQEELILRVYPGNSSDFKAEHEFLNLTRLFKAGYPVPAVHHLVLAPNSPFNMPFLVMDKINGCSLGSLMFEQPTENSAEWLTLFCDIFARLHSLDVDAFASECYVPDHLRGAAPYLIEQELGKWHPYFKLVEGSDFKRGLDWLERWRNTIKNGRLSAIHWDFHPYNIIIKPDNTPVVIDWTGFTLSDFRFDLGWTLVLTGSIFGGRWRELILKEYERQAGFKVAQIEYFEVAACLRRLFSMVVMASGEAEKLGLRPISEADRMDRLTGVKAVYDMLQERSGLKLHDVEGLLSSSL